MKRININIKRMFENKSIGNIVIFMALIIFIYILVSIYFARHFFFHTEINGVNVSLKTYDEADNVIGNYIKAYKLQLMERGGKTEAIIGQDIGMQYNEKNYLSDREHRQNPFKWGSSVFKKQKYYIKDLFSYNKDMLESRINGLNCLNKDIIEPQNVSFKYSNGYYETVKEVYGNKLNKEKLKSAIDRSILTGELQLNLDEKLCYEAPEYILSSDKTLKTKNLLNKYAGANITYKFGNDREKLDGNTINKWITVDRNLDAIISEAAVMKYVNVLSKKYNTVGIARNFKTSIGKTVEVKGGLYGWKINTSAETKALLQNIELGETIEKEPIYIQRAVARGSEEIGNTYVEINITRQHLWFYKDGKLITQGAVVTGNPNRDCSTVLGTYMLNYKQKNATLTGPDYEAPVTYWMPFFGNIGIHDASWRYSFGGEIYKRNGTHGCVNAPLYLAKTIFENIEDGTPVVCYEE